LENMKNIITGMAIYTGIVAIGQLVVALTA
jgi:hypothetical protein